MQESKFEFKTPYLVESRFEVNYEYDSDLPTNISQNFETEVAMNDDKTHAIVSLMLILSSDENKPFDLQLKYISEFKWNEGMEESMYLELLRVNAPTLLLSYMRPMVAALTSASPLPTYQIPFMDFTDYNS